MVGSFSFCVVAPVAAMALGDSVCRRCRGDGVWADEVADGVAAMASGQTDSTSQAALRARKTPPPRAARK